MIVIDTDLRVLGLKRAYKNKEKQSSFLSLIRLQTAENAHASFSDNYKNKHCV